MLIMRREKLLKRVLMYRRQTKIGVEIAVEGTSEPVVEEKIEHSAHAIAYEASDNHSLGFWRTSGED